MKNVINKIIATIIALVVVVGVLPTTTYSASYDYRKCANLGVVVYELNTNQVLTSQNADKRFFPGSITKVMTVLTAMDYMDQLDVITVAEEELDLVEPNSSLAGLMVGEELTFGQLTYATLIPSGNDAARVMGVKAGRVILENPDAKADTSMKAFIKRMNDKAKELGMKSTSFANADGYDDEKNYSTPNDLVLLAKEALKNEFILDCVGRTSKYIETNKKTRTWRTTNMLMVEDFDMLHSSFRHGENPYYVDGVYGMKTGYTDEGGRCLLSVYKEPKEKDKDDNDDMCLITVVLNIHEGGRDEVFSRSKDLIDFAHNNYSTVDFINEDTELIEKKVLNRGFWQDRTLNLVPAEDTKKTVERMLSEDYTYVFVPNDKVKLMDEDYNFKLAKNISKDEIVGSMVFRKEGIEVHRINYCAENSYRKFGLIEIAIILGSIIVAVFIAVNVSATIKDNKRKREIRNSAKK